jgi:hypothetical protein
VVIGGGYTEFAGWLIHNAKTEEPKTEVQQLQIGLALRLNMFAVAGHPSDGAMIKISEFALEEHVSIVS